MSYVEYVRSRTPPWLSGYWGQALVDALAVAMDAVVQATEDAISTRHFKRWTIDALEFEGEDKLMRKALGESVENYRTRLSRGHKYWSQAGTAAGLIRALADVGFTATLDEAGGTDWYYFRVLITAFPADFLSGLWKWNDGTAYGPSVTWGGVSPYLGSMVREIIQQFKPCYAYNYEIRVTLPNSGGYINLQPVK